MSDSMAKKLSPHSFWLSLIVHILILLALFRAITQVKPPDQPLDKQQKTPHDYVPAYTYTGSIKPSAQRATSQQTEKSVQSKPSNPSKGQDELADNSSVSHAQIDSAVHEQSAIQVQKAPKKTQTARKSIASTSLLSDSLNMIKDDQMRDVTKAQESEPIYLIGDDSMPADPLIKLMGRSLSTHFGYPRTAGELGIRGRVLVEFILHPEGYYTDIRMVHSSSSPDLDAAALYAVNSAPRVIGADRFISKPKHFVVGFVFY